MKEKSLIEKSKNFAVDIINMGEYIKGKSILVNQIIKSATSIGANIREANYAQSKKDFISKLEIALKECYETEYWLELLFDTNAVDEQSFKNAGSIRRMLIASIKTAKTNSN